MDTEVKEDKKGHHKRQAGRKADKKKAKDKHEQELTARQRNPKAFAFHSVNKVARTVRRSLDIREKKHHIPVVDRTPIEPPPIIVAVVGPPKVGKSTLVQCLIKNFTKTKLSNIKGPVSIVSGKKRRLTIIECNNDINSMIDVAKVADLVLLMVDASFGFEMEIFEFLNICQVHGFPRIMGVLTHLDHFKENKTLRKTKKRLKHRFWTEVYQGSKLFYLSGMVNGEYQRTEIHNLGRFISVMKFRPLQWRTTHPYVLTDRMEDVTDPELLRKGPKHDRSVCLYGYVRGTHFKNNSHVHIPGCGDFMIHDMNLLPDPCGLPTKETKRRRLNESERNIYAPFSGVGGIVYDKDAVYIDTGGSHFHKAEQEGGKPVNELVGQMIDTRKQLDQKIDDSELTLFKGGPTISSSEVEKSNFTQMPEEKLVIDQDGRTRRKAILGDDDEDESDDSEDEEENDSGEEEIEDDDEDNHSDQSEDEDIDEAKTSGAPKKKLKVDLDNFAFADSDDDLEAGAQLKANSAKRVNKSEKQKKKPQDESDEDESDEEEENDSSDDEEEDDESEDNSEEEEGESESKTKPAKSPLGRPKSNNPIKDKIAEALQKINKPTPSKVAEKKESGKESEDESDEDMSVAGDEEEEEEEEGDYESGYAEEEGSDDEDGDSEENDSDASDGVNGSEAEEEIGHLKWKDNLAAKARDAFYRRQSDTTNLRKLVYGRVREVESDEEEGGDDIGGLFKVAKRDAEARQKNRITANAPDCSLFHVEQLQDWDLEEVMEQIKDCFVTGKWDPSEDAETLLKQDDELYGDFEDLETGEVHKAEDEEDEEAGSEKEEDENKPDIYETREEERQRKVKEKREEKKKRLKDMFDREYDDKDGEKTGGTMFDSLKAEMQEQAQMNRQEFEGMDDETRAQYEGFRPGLYVRIQINNMPCEFVDNFDPTYPVILGALNSAEQNIGCVHVRLKKHRWHKKILKSRDPLIISLGWRRFQSLALFTIQDHNMRNRLLKYTPEHLHCNAAFWGPITPQGTGLLAVQTVAGNTANFRICATGVVLELDKSLTIVKKLKLTGTPTKVYKKTAFIEGMFNTSLEAAKFEGASLRTVSGVRGQIKKAANKPEGSFRATFEDKILLKDIVFVRTWYQVAIPSLYNPVTTLLLPPEEKEKWQGMKTVGQLRREAGIRREVNEDHLYKDIKRKEKVYKPLKIPKELQRNLPFKDKPKEAKKMVDSVQDERVAVIRDTKEKKVAELMGMLKTLHTEKMRKRRVEMRQRAAKHQKEQARIDVHKNAKQKEVKKQIYRALGKKEKRKEKAKSR